MTYSREEVEAARERLREWADQYHPVGSVPVTSFGAAIIDAHIEALEAALRNCRHWIRDELGWPKPDWPLPDGEDLLAAIDALLPEARDES